MYAIIANGGKQYQVAKGDEIRLEKCPADIGATVDFNEVLLVSDGENQLIGAPYVEGAKVTVEVVDHSRAKKVHIIKFKRRKHHMKQMGHRQHYTSVKVVSIETGKQ